MSQGDAHDNSLQMSLRSQLILSKKLVDHRKYIGLRDHVILCDAGSQSTNGDASQRHLTCDVASVSGLNSDVYEERIFRLEGAKHNLDSHRMSNCVVFK